MNRKVSLSAINEWLWQTTTQREVSKDLSDTKWDWLRTPRGLTGWLRSPWPGAAPAAAVPTQSRARSAGLGC